MRILISFLLLFSLFGCATLAQKETFAVCKTADVLTTTKILGSGGTEVNPLNNFLLKSFGMGGLVVFSVALVAFIWAYEEDIDPRTLAAANVVTCGAVIHNVGEL